MALGRPQVLRFHLFMLKEVGVHQEDTREAIGILPSPIVHRLSSLNPRPHMTQFHHQTRKMKLNLGLHLRFRHFLLEPEIVDSRFDVQF